MCEQMNGRSANLTSIIKCEAEERGGGRKKEKSWERESWIDKKKLVLSS